MQTFVVLLRGANIKDARTVAASVDPSIASQVAAHILNEPAKDVSRDPVISAIYNRRSQTLQFIRDAAL